MNKTCSSFALLAALGGSASTMACGDEAPGARTLANVGTLSAPLAGASSLGFEYRLRNAVLSVEGPTTATIDSEDYLDQPFADITLSAGAYTIALAPGWTLEREEDGAFVPVEATLTSDALQGFTIVANQRSTVVFKFQAGEDVLEVGEGGLGVVLDVEDAQELPDDPGIPDTEATEEACRDSKDNDNDGFEDCDDPGCELSSRCGPQPNIWKMNQWAMGYSDLCGIRSDHFLACLDGYNPLAGVMLDEIVSGFDGDTTCYLTYPDHRVLCSIAGTEFQTGEFRSVAVGQRSVCATRPSGELLCWGEISQPGLSLGGGPTNFASAAVGLDHGCYIGDGPTCWGRNWFGQLAAPTQDLSSLAAGQNHTCGLSSGKTAICWGDNREGQLRAPTAAFSQLSAGFLHTCGVKEDGSLACWGNDQEGRSTPPSGDDFMHVHAGAEASCAQRSDGSFSCWGKSQVGREISDDFLTVPVPPMLRAPQAGPWTTIVPLRVNQDQYPDLLYYDSATGRAVYAAGTATPGIEEVVLETSYAPGFTDILPVWHTEESTLTDLTFYDSVTGNYSATIATGEPGVQTELYSGAGSPGFTVVVPMTMDADGLTDALWYDPESGVGIFSASMGARNEVNLGKGWTTILPVHLNADADTDLLYYDRMTGSMKLTVATGPATQNVLLDHQWLGPGWTALLPIDINGDHFTDVVRYDASSGTAVYTVLFAKGEVVDVRATQERPGQTLFASMPNYRDRSQSFIAAFGNVEAP